MIQFLNAAAGTATTAEMLISFHALLVYGEVLNLYQWIGVILAIISC